MYTSIGIIKFDVYNFSPLGLSPYVLKIFGGGLISSTLKLKRITYNRGIIILLNRIRLSPLPLPQLNAGIELSFLDAYMSDFFR